MRLRKNKKMRQLSIKKLRMRVDRNDSIYVNKQPNSHIGYDLPTAIDDPEFFKMTNNDVILGVYGTEDWILADAARKRHEKGMNTLQLDITWLTNSKFDLVALTYQLKAEDSQFTFVGANRVLICRPDDSVLKITSGGGKIEVEIIGHPEWVRKTETQLDGLYKRAENLIQWVYSTDGNEISVPLNYRPAINAAYPWLNKPVLDYIDDYLNSSATILLLIGPPGSGKSTLLKNIIHRSGGNAKVAYDEKVMAGDGLFAGFIDSETNILVMEDADNFLKPRKDGNDMMHKFLNVSDGLISAADKKLIFTTNLPNINDIDSALLRPGRCFDVVYFRPLDREEAQAVIDEAGVGKLPDGNKIILADIFSEQPSATPNKKRHTGPTFY